MRVRRQRARRLLVQIGRSSTRCISAELEDVAHLHPAHCARRTTVRAGMPPQPQPRCRSRCRLYSRFIVDVAEVVVRRLAPATRFRCDTRSSATAARLAAVDADGESEGPPPMARSSLPSPSAAAASVMAFVSLVCQFHVPRTTAKTNCSGNSPDCALHLGDQKDSLAVADSGMPKNAASPAIVFTPGVWTSSRTSAATSSGSGLRNSAIWRLAL